MSFFSNLTSSISSATSNISLFGKGKTSEVSPGSIQSQEAAGAAILKAYPAAEATKNDEISSLYASMADDARASGDKAAAGIFDMKAETQAAAENKASYSSWLDSATASVKNLFGNQSENTGSAGSTSGFSLGDAGKRLNEGYDALAKKFSATDIKGQFSKAAGSAKEFLFGTSPEQLKKLDAAAQLKQTNALAAAAEGQASAAALRAQIEAADSARAKDVKYFVSLTDPDGFSIRFDVMPEVQESRSVEYEAVAPPQFPGAFQKYKGTSSVQYTVNVSLISRTSDEATKNLLYLNKLRQWTMPVFGEANSFDSMYGSRIGSPPPVLRFHGYRESMIGPVPTVLTSLSWQFPRDVDYIPAARLNLLIDDETGVQTVIPGEAVIPFPVVLQVSLQLVESYSTDQFDQMSYSQYGIGKFSTSSKFAFKSPENPAATKKPEAQSVAAPPVLPTAGSGFGNVTGSITGSVSSVSAAISDSTKKAPISESLSALPAGVSAAASLMPSSPSVPEPNFPNIP